MVLEFFNSNKNNPSHVVRVLLPFGVYPAKPIITQDSLFYMDEELCFSVVPFNRVKADRKHSHPEVELTTINEIRLFSSILLCAERSLHYLSIYPFRYPHYLKLASLSEVINNTKNIKSILIDIISSSGRSIPQYNFRATNVYMKLQKCFLPPVCGGNRYNLRKEGIRYELQKMLFSRFDISNHLLVRGTSSLLRSVMISAHMLFLEEAVSLAFISLDASFKLILKELAREGEKNPTTAETVQYISKIFYSKAANKYFEEYYDRRIMSHPPLTHDGYNELLDDLMAVYCYLICRYIDPKHEGRFT